MNLMERPEAEYCPFLRDHTVIIKMAERVAVIETKMIELVDHVGTQNGRVRKLEDRSDTHERQLEKAEWIAVGKRQQRDEDIAKLNAIQTFFSDFWPLILGGVLGISGIGFWIWSALP